MVIGLLPVANNIGGRWGFRLPPKSRVIWAQERSVHGSSAHLPLMEGERVLEFLWKRHVPNKGEQVVRYYCYYSNPWRGASVNRTVVRQRWVSSLGEYL